MKSANLFLLLAMLALAAGVGCKKNPKPLTFIPGQEPKITDDATTRKAIPPVGDGRILADPNDPRFRPLTGDDAKPENVGLRPLEGTAEDRERLAAQTVYFDFDKSAIKSAERAKLDSVGSFLKNTPTASLKIEGHCDERGTEEYNRALGERRAIAARDYLVQSQGIDSTRITTVSFGEDKPADPGHDESAFSKNRRAEFVVLGTGSP
jgi:peptidoglycan-associated lipoprotein